LVALLVVSLGDWVGGRGRRGEWPVLMRMYVASDSAPSVQARRQLAALRERFGGEDWEVEVEVEVVSSSPVSPRPTAFLRPRV